MKRNKGFTLFEILIVIIIIGVLFTIAVVSANNYNKKMNQKLYKEKIDYILVAAKQFGEDSKDNFTGPCFHLEETTSDAKCFNITVLTLVENKYLKPEDTVDPRDNSSMSGLNIEVQNYYNRVHAVIDEGGTDLSGALLINNGDPTTPVRKVNLQIIAYNPNVNKMCISNTKSCNNWENYIQIKPGWELPNNAGKHNVYLWFKDNLNNVSNSISSSIIYDPDSLTSSILINNGDTYTNKTNVTLNINSTASSMCISNTSSCTTWESYKTSRSWTIPSGDGVKVVRAWFRDEDGSRFDEANSSIILDTVPPTGSITINSGNSFTGSRNVTLTLSASDTGSNVKDMCISNTSSCTTWENYATTKTWTILDDDGEKTVYIKYRDNALNESIVYSDKIILDTKSPTNNTISINNNVQYTNTRVVNLTLSSSDDSSGVQSMCVSQTPICTTWIPYNTTLAINLTIPNDGEKTVYVIYKDLVGNMSSQVSSKIFLDTIKPVCSVSGGSSSWTNNSRKVIGTCSDDGGSGCTGNIQYDYTTNINTTTAGAAGNNDGGRVYDKAGNFVDCLANQTVKIDKTPPTCTVSGGNDAWTNTSKRVTGTCSDTGGSNCTGNIQYDYTTNINTTTAGAAGNNNGGRVYDGAGNHADCLANQTVKVDKTPPTCTVSAKSNTYTQTGVTVTVTANDTGGSGYASGAGLKTGLKQNTTFTVYDSAGNSGTCSVLVYSENRTRKSTCATYNPGTCLSYGNYSVTTSYPTSCSEWGSPGDYQYQRCSVNNWKCKCKCTEKQTPPTYTVWSTVSNRCQTKCEQEYTQPKYCCNKSLGVTGTSTGVNTYKKELYTGSCVNYQNGTCASWHPWSGWTTASCTAVPDQVKCDGPKPFYY